jgi:hypothetical protein
MQDQLTGPEESHESQAAPILDYRKPGARRPKPIKRIPYHLQPTGLPQLFMFLCGFAYGVGIVVLCVIYAPFRNWMLEHHVFGSVLFFGVPGLALLPIRRWRWATLGIALAAGLGFLVVYAVGSTLQTMYGGF